MNYEYTLEVKDVDSGAMVGRIEAYSEDSLEEQWHKIHSSIKEYERTHQKCFVCGFPTDEKHHIPQEADDPNGKVEWCCGPCFKKINGKYAAPYSIEYEDELNS